MGHAVVVEVVRVVALQVPSPSTPLLKACARHAGTLLRPSSSPNHKLAGLGALGALVTRDVSFCEPHQSEIVDCLVHRDTTLRRRALDLLFRMAHRGNKSIIADQALIYLARASPYDDIAAVDAVAREVLRLVVHVGAEGGAPGTPGTSGTHTGGGATPGAVYADLDEVPGWGAGVLLEVLRMAGDVMTEETRILVLSGLAEALTSPAAWGVTWPRLLAILRSTVSAGDAEREAAVWAAGEAARRGGDMAEGKVERKQKNIRTDQEKDGSVPSSPPTLEMVEDLSDALVRMLEVRGESHSSRLHMAVLHALGKILAVAHHLVARDTETHGRKGIEMVGGDVARVLRRALGGPDLGPHEAAAHVIQLMERSASPGSTSVSTHYTSHDMDFVQSGLTTKRQRAGGGHDTEDWRTLGFLDAYCEMAVASGRGGRFIPALDREHPHHLGVVSPERKGHVGGSGSGSGVGSGGGGGSDLVLEHRSRPARDQAKGTADTNLLGVPDNLLLVSDAPPPPPTMTPPVSSTHDDWTHVESRDGVSTGAVLSTLGVPASGESSEHEREQAMLAAMVRGRKQRWGPSTTSGVGGGGGAYGSSESRSTAPAPRPGSEGRARLAVELFGPESGSGSAPRATATATATATAMVATATGPAPDMMVDLLGEEPSPGAPVMTAAHGHEHGGRVVSPGRSDADGWTGEVDGRAGRGGGPGTTGSTTTASAKSKVLRGAKSDPFADLLG